MSTVVKSPRAAFSLLELAVVLVIVGLVTAMAVTSGIGVVKSAKVSATQQKMAAISQALQAYRSTNDRLPCPASNAIAEGATNFGVEAATPGTCTGGTPAANYSAAGTINTSKTAVEGSLPVVTLGLPNEMMYDGWGNRFRYAVDKSATATRAFSSIPNGCTNLAISIKNANNTSITDAALYAIISHGENGHGSFTRTGVQVNTGSTNTSEQLNCHCDNTATDTTYTPTYVQKELTTDPTDSLNSFDDLVSYKERWQMLTPWEKAESCTVEYLYVVDSGNNRIQKFSLDGTFISKWGSTGTANGEFNNLAGGGGGIAADTSGNILVADMDNDRIQKFDTEGNFISKFGTYGSANGELNGPWGIAVDSSNNIWVAEYWGVRVQKFDSNGNYILKFGSSGSGDGQFNTAVGVTVHGNYVYVGDHANMRVQKFDLSGNFQTKYTFGTAPSGVRPFYSNAIDDAGNMYIGNSWVYGIAKFDSSGTYITTIAPTGGAENGNVFSNPAVALDSSGNIWITDPGNNRVQKFDSSGNWLMSLGGPSPHTCTTTPAPNPGPACAAGTGDGQFDAPKGLLISR